MNTFPNRRLFLQTAAGAVGAFSAMRALGANDKVNIAVIGLGGRGRNHMTYYSKMADVRIGALCDVDQSSLERGQAFVEKASGVKPTGYADMRQVFEDKSIDAVSMPLPNHWHALATIWACQAGKDVYVEKPACHNMWEGSKMVEAARKYNRMVQIGSQSRDMPHKMKAMELLHQGIIGKVYMAKGLCYKRRKSIGIKPDGQVPAGVDWDKFLGPAPMRAFNENRFKYNWHWFWDTGNGDIGNQGVHEMDVARWGLGKEGLPKAIVSTGGKYAYVDDQETPNTELASFDYGDCELVFEVRGILTGEEGGLKRKGGNVIGNLFYGPDGYMAVDGSGYQVYKGEKLELAEEGKDTPGEETIPHMQNFIDAVKSRKYQNLNADVQIGVTSANLCHMANIAYRLGRRLQYDSDKKHFVGEKEANEMMTRKYRAPYVVPEKV